MSASVRKHSRLRGLGCSFDGHFFLQAFYILIGPVSCLPSPSPRVKTLPAVTLSHVFSCFGFSHPLNFLRLIFCVKIAGVALVFPDQISTHGATWHTFLHGALLLREALWRANPCQHPSLTHTDCWEHPTQNDVSAHPGAQNIPTNLWNMLHMHSNSNSKHLFCDVRS